MSQPKRYQIPELLQQALDEQKPEKPEKWNVKDLAKNAGINYQSLCNNVNGEAPMSLANGLKLLQALKLDFPTHPGIDLLKSIRDHYDYVQENGMEKKSASTLDE